MRFLLRNTSNNLTQYLDTPREVAVFLWGRDMRDWTVALVLPPHLLPREVGELEAVLDWMKVQISPNRTTASPSPIKSIPPRLVKFCPQCEKLFHIRGRLCQSCENDVPLIPLSQESHAPRAEETEPDPDLQAS